MELRSELTAFWGQEERWLWDMDTSTLRMFTERQGRVHKLTNFLEVPYVCPLSAIQCCRRNLCAETCIFASSLLHCIMNGSLSHAWKHMWQDGLFSRCARFLSTCRGLRGGRGRREEGWWDGTEEQRRGGLSLNGVWEERLCDHQREAKYFHGRE